MNQAAAEHLVELHLGLPIQVFASLIHGRNPDLDIVGKSLAVLERKLELWLPADEIVVEPVDAACKINMLPARGYRDCNPRWRSRDQRTSDRWRQATSPIQVKQRICSPEPRTSIGFCFS